ncbi:MAG: hypothetical protein WC655_26360 [Candidatus Hydrogenedentales bacterium]|jgi:chromosome segregation ATPase
MSDTPRTDDADREYSAMPDDDDAWNNLRNFARQLERELSETKAKLATANDRVRLWHGQTESARETAEGFARECERLGRELGDLYDWRRDAIVHNHKLVHEICRVTNEKIDAENKVSQFGVELLNARQEVDKIQSIKGELLESVKTLGCENMELKQEVERLKQREYELLEKLEQNYTMLMSRQQEEERLNRIIKAADITRIDCISMHDCTAKLWKRYENARGIQSPKALTGRPV